MLSKMIDWVHVQGKITKQLCEMAHKIKLGRNLAAHASDHALTEADADAVLEFTDEYFHHIYTMPAKMAKFDLDKTRKEEDTMSNPEFEKFDAVMRRLMSVSHEEIQRRDKKWRRKRATKKRAKKPASRASSGKG